MSNTPRTDAAREWYERGDNYQYALPVADTDMAKLERELQAMTAARNKAVEVLVNLARVNDEWTEDDDPTSVLECFGNIALDAARVLREPEAQ